MGTGVEEIDYGPLAGLIGTWTGDKGMDIAPEPEGVEKNPYFETITFEAIGDVTNAETQTLAVLHYRQIVSRKSDNNVFHDETGYWMWDPKTSTVIHSLTIPRAVCVLAGGKYAGETDEAGNILLKVEASLDSRDWSIIQSPFMRDKARTTSFRQQVALGPDTLSYTETTMLHIYGRAVEHTDSNELTRQTS